MKVVTYLLKRIGGYTCPRCNEVFVEQFPRGEFWCGSCKKSYSKDYNLGWFEV